MLLNLTYAFYLRLTMIFQVVSARLKTWTMYLLTIAGFISLMLMLTQPALAQANQNAQNVPLN